MDQMRRPHYLSRIELLTSKEQNRRMKMYNGNRQWGHSISISHWNAGSTHWQRKKEEIEALVLQKNPDILYISEANLMEDVTEEERHVEGYRLILPKTMISLKHARLVLLVKEELEIRILDNIMTDDICIIWIQFGQPRRKPLTIGGIYREQHLLLQGTPNMSGSVQHQHERWRKTIQSWKTAARKDRCIIIGDFNLDYGRWQQPDHHQVQMVNRVKNEIETLFFLLLQIMRGITRSMNHQEDSIIDHCWTNAVERIISHSNEARGSDHNFISVRARYKDRVLDKQDIIKRVRRNMDTEWLKEHMKGVDWTELLESMNVNVINGILEHEIVTALVDRVTPLKVIQVRSIYKNWVSSSLKEKMKERNSWREKARLSGENEHWMIYRNLRNECTRDLKRVKN